jgi:hypothetical protein
VEEGKAERPLAGLRQGDDGYDMSKRKIQYKSQYKIGARKGRKRRRRRELK